MVSEAKTITFCWPLRTSASEGNESRIKSTNELPHAPEIKSNETPLLLQSLMNLCAIPSSMSSRSASPSDTSWTPMRHRVTHTSYHESSTLGMVTSFSTSSFYS